MKIRTKILPLLVLALAGWVVVELGLAAVTLGAEPPATPAPTPPAPPQSPPVALAVIQVEPAKLVLLGKWASYAIVVTGQLSDGSVRDFTAAAQFTSANPAIAAVGPDGVIRPVADGEVPLTVVAKLGESTASAPVAVTVKEAANEAANFLRDVMPLFTKLGCNAIQCHGSALGKGGFRLSMFGAEPDADYETLTKAVLDLSRKANCPVLATQGGGYNMPSTIAAATACVKVLATY